MDKSFIKENIGELVSGVVAVAMIAGSIAGTTWLLSAMYYTLLR